MTYPDHQKLRQLAEEQKGYFTAAQARSCGYGWSLLSHHASRGQFRRIRRGLYRLRDFPSSRHEDLMAAWLAAGKHDSFVSHESALELLDLSDLIPSSVHLTVGRARRGIKSAPIITLHTSTRFPREEELWTTEGLAHSSPERAIAESAEWGTPPEQLELAVLQAIRRGLTTPERLRQEAAGRDESYRRVLRRALDRRPE